MGLETVGACLYGSEELARDGHGQGQYGKYPLVFIGTAVATLQGFLPGYGDTGWLLYRAAHQD